jgi:hypothetical protein
MSRKTLSDSEIVNLLFIDDEEDIENLNGVDIEDDVISDDIVSNDNSAVNVTANIDDNLGGRHSDSSQSNTDIESDEFEIPHRVAPVKRKRKTLTGNRLVRSLDASLNVDNYNVVKVPTREENYKVTLVKGTKKVPAKVISWVNKSSEIGGRQGAENILRTRGGSINNSNSALSCLETWHLFMTDTMLSQIVNYTNININKRLSDNDINIGNMDKKNSCHIKITTVEEIKAFIGLLYARGLFSLSHQNYQHLFRDGIGHPIFGAVMSSNRFMFLNSNIRFDAVTSRAERFPSDRFAAIRELFENFNDRCSSVLQPDEYLALDETLYGCRNQI